MVPKSLLLRDVGAGVQWIDHPGAGRAGGRHHHHGHRAVGAVEGNGAQQRLRIHTAPAVGIDQAQRRAAHSRLVHGLQPRNVAVA